MLKPAQEAACGAGALRALAVDLVADLFARRAVVAISPLLSRDVLFYAPGGLHLLELGNIPSSLLYLFALLDAPASGSSS